MKFLLKVFLLLAAGTAGAQEISYGVKAGTSMANGARITGLSHAVDGEYFYWTGNTESRSKAGYHAGAFLEMDFGDFFLRPELSYAALRSEFVIPYKTAAYNINSFEVPILLGYNIPRLFGIYAGPAYFKNISNTLQDKQWSVVQVNGEKRHVPGAGVKDPDIPVNLQVGLKIDFQRLGLDLRYAYGLGSSSPEEIDMINKLVGTQPGGINKAIFEANMNQVIFSMTYKIGIPESRRSFGHNLGYGPRR